MTTAPKPEPGVTPMERLIGFVEGERKHNPGTRHIAEWALEEIERLTTSRQVWLAYRCSRRSYYDGEPSTDHEFIIDADTDAIALVRRVNANYATAETIRDNRGKQMTIPAFATKSNRIWGNGGGCDYEAWLEIRQAPRLELKPEKKS